MRSVGLKVLKNRLSEYVRAAAAGETVLVTDRGQVVAELLPPRVRADASSGPTLVLLDELERADNAVATFLDRITREPREAPVHVVAAVRPGELQNPRLKKLLTDTGVVPSLARITLELATS